MSTVPQTRRIPAIDFARGLSVLMVILVHTLWMYGNPVTQTETALGSVIHFIGKGTPMFLIAMGISFTLSRNQSILLSVKRAFYILAIGYLMNFLKFVLPVLLDTVPNTFIEAYGWAKPVTFEQMLYMLGTGDILQLAGVSLLMMGFIAKLSKTKYVPLAIALCIIVSTKEVRGLRVGIMGLDYLLDLFWGAEWNVYFAVFPWFSFILIGMFFGLWYKETHRSEVYMFTRMTYFGILGLIAGGGLCYYNFDYHFGDYFHLGPGGTLYLAGFNLLLFGLAYVLVTTLKENPIFRFFYYCSKRVTTLYVIQWVLICWGMNLFGYQQFGVSGVLILIPLFTALTLGVHYFVLDPLLFKRSSGNTKEILDHKKTWSKSPG